MFKKKIDNFLTSFDIKIIRYKSSLPIDFSKDNFHPKTLSYLCEPKKAIVNLNIEQGRTNRFFSLDNNSFDPYLFALNQSLKNNYNEEKLYSSIFEILEYYKKKIVSKNISDLFGLNSNKKLNSYPLWSAVMPWDSITIQEKFLNFPKSVKVDRAKNGLIINSDNPEIIMKEDEINSLPSHVNQYVRLINSIKKNGYIPNLKNSFIEVEILVKGQNFCWKPSGEGNHRTTVVASMGYNTINTLVTKIIRFEDIEYWPNVINKTFKAEEAQIIFNRFFDARPPEFNKAWVVYCNDLKQYN
jgi:hypothetical protein